MPTYNRAYEAIVHNLVQFSLSRYINGRHVNISGADRSFHGSDGTPPPVGALVALCCVVHPNKWALSWYRGVHRMHNGMVEYTLESIKDRSIGFWSNVELRWLPLETSQAHPEWRWNDTQFALNDRWKRQADTLKAHTFTPRQMRWINEGKTPVLVVGRRFSDEEVTRPIHDRKGLSATAMRAFLQDARNRWDELRAQESEPIPVHSDKA